MEDPTPLSPASLRPMFEQAGLQMTEDELSQLGLSSARARVLQDSLSGMFGSMVEPAPVFSALQAYTQEEQ
jgi:hypothetical protein